MEPLLKLVPTSMFNSQWLSFSLSCTLVWGFIVTTNGTRPGDANIDPEVHTTRTSHTGLGQGRESLLVKVEREINPSTTEFSQVEKQKILHLLNRERRNSGASNMMILNWHDDLEGGAKRWANGCVFELPNKHYKTSIGQFSTVGVNIYESQNHQLFPDQVVKDWNAQKHDYDFFTNTCTRSCSFYRTNVWATTRYVGCAVNYCQRLVHAKWPGFYMVCYYAPKGDKTKPVPYHAGPPCSRCPVDARECYDGLCSYSRNITIPNGNVISLHRTGRNAAKVASYLLLSLLSAPCSSL